MKNFLSNKSMRIARSLILGLMFALAFAVSFSGGGQALSGDSQSVIAYAHPNEFLEVAGFMLIVVLATSLMLKHGYTKSERRGYAFMAACDIGPDIEIALDCDEDIEAGVEARLIIANKADIASWTYSGTNNMLLTSLVMKTGKQFFVIDGIKTSTRPSWDMVKTKPRNKFKHQVKFVGFSIDPAFMKEVNKMKDGNFVVGIANNQVGTTGNQKWDFYGFGTGLGSDAIGRDPFSQDTAGAINIGLASDDEALESKPPVRLFITDAVTTEALITTLTAPAV